jgi:hypothetical protein
LKRIEASAFFEAVVKSSITPKIAEFIDDLAVSSCEAVSVDIEDENNHFKVERYFLFHFDDRTLSPYFGRSDSV